MSFELFVNRSLAFADSVQQWSYVFGTIHSVALWPQMRLVLHGGWGEFNTLILCLNSMLDSSKRWPSSPHAAPALRITITAQVIVRRDKRSVSEPLPSSPCTKPSPAVV